MIVNQNTFFEVNSTECVRENIYRLNGHLIFFFGMQIIRYYNFFIDPLKNK